MEQPIIFFDGVCALCNSSIDYIIKADNERLFKFAPLQGETALAAKERTDWRDIDSIILLENDQLYYRSSAIIRIGQLIPKYRLLSNLISYIPVPIRDYGYKLIAKYRYQTFGKKATCRIPTVEERAIFLP